MAEKIQFGETVIALRRAQGFTAAADAMRGGSGQGPGMSFEGAVRQMQNEELHLLVQRNADAKRRLGRGQEWSCSLAPCLGLLVAAAAGWSVQRDHSRRALAEDALREGETRFSTLANNTSQLTLMADVKGYAILFGPTGADSTTPASSRRAK